MEEFIYIMFEGKTPKLWDKMNNIGDGCITTDKMNNIWKCFMFTLVAATLDPMDATVSIQFYKKNKIGYTKKKKW